MRSSHLYRLGRGLRIFKDKLREDVFGAGTVAD